MRACSAVSIHRQRLVGEGTRRRRRKLINQPNENIPADTKTSYSHIKVKGGEIRGDSGRRWRNEVRDCGREAVGGYKGMI